MKERSHIIAPAKETRRAVVVKSLSLGSNVFEWNKERECSGELLGRMPLVAAWLRYADEHQIERQTPSEILLEEDMRFLYSLEPDKPLSLMRSAYFALAEESTNWLEYILRDMPDDFLQEFFTSIGASRVVLRSLEESSFFVLTAEDVSLFYRHLYHHYRPLVDWLVASNHKEEGQVLLHENSQQEECYAKIIDQPQNKLLLVSVR